MLRRLLRRRERPAPTEGLVSVKERAGRLFVVWSSAHGGGAWIVAGFVELDAGAAPAEVGAAVEEALRRSAEHPEPGDAWDRLLRAAGVRSWGSFVKGLASVSVARSGDAVEVTPDRNLGAREGLRAIEEERVALDAPGAEELGHAVRRALARAERGAAPAAEAPATGGGGEVVPFGRRAAWLAVRSGDAAAVARELRITGASEASWREGLDAVERGATFLSPPVDGWTLVVLGRPDAAVDLAGLSRSFGEAQRYASHRVVDLYAWERWVGGAPVRRFRYVGESGEVEADEGEPSAAESREPDEDAVLDVAREWSVDPSALDDRAAGRGLVGRL